tara:strand:+ start:121 stop:366 length:246 start_codon:yes stop_codon:yes gene_type:complete
MDTIYLDDFSDQGIIKEDIFRHKVNSFEWEKFKNKKVLIKGCSKIPIPTWAYLIITAKLTLYASSIVFGEPCSAVKIFKKN